MAYPNQAKRAAVLERLATLRGREPNMSPELIRKSLRSTICSPARFESDFGLECHMDLAAGIEEEVRWMRESGLV